MKKKIFATMIIIFAVFSITMTAQAAATATVDVKLNSDKVKVGETFQVTISAQCDDGINAIDTSYTYDDKQLELISANVLDTNNWANLSSNNQITVICNSSSKITNADIYALTFKVKDSATIGNIASIDINQILLDTDSSENSEQTIEGKKLNITILSKENDNENPSENDKNNIAPDNNQNSDTNNTSNGNNQNSDKNSIINTNTQNQDSSTANGKLPQTGETRTILWILLTVCMITVISYIVYRKYNI